MGYMLFKLYKYNGTFGYIMGNENEVCANGVMSMEMRQKSKRQEEYDLTHQKNGVNFSYNQIINPNIDEIKIFIIVNRIHQL